jgi:hypothetical protein
MFILIRGTFKIFNQTLIVVIPLIKDENLKIEFINAYKVILLIN